MGGAAAPGVLPLPCGVGGVGMSGFGFPALICPDAAAAPSTEDVEGGLECVEWNESCAFVASRNDVVILMSGVDGGAPDGGGNDLVCSCSFPKTVSPSPAGCWTRSWEVEWRLSSGCGRVSDGESACDEVAVFCEVVDNRDWLSVLTCRNAVSWC